MRTDQAAYNWFNNRPDSGSQDFHNVIAWLTAHRAPEPTISYMVLDSQGFPYGGLPEPIMQLTFAGYPTPMDASLVLNSPGVALVMLGLEANMLNYAPPTAPAPRPIPISGNPVGAATGTVINGKNQYFFDGQSTPLADGTIFPGPEGDLILQRRDTPFGPWMRWNPR